MIMAICSSFEEMLVIRGFDPQDYLKNPFQNSPGDLFSDSLIHYCMELEPGFRKDFFEAGKDFVVAPDHIPSVKEKVVRLIHTMVETYHEKEYIDQPGKYIQLLNYQIYVPNRPIRAKIPHQLNRLSRLVLFLEKAVAHNFPIRFFQYSDYVYPVNTTQSILKQFPNGMTLDHLEAEMENKKIRKNKEKVIETLINARLAYKKEEKFFLTLKGNLI